PGWPGYPRTRSRRPEDSPARTRAQEIARRSLAQNDTRRDESFLRHSRGRAARLAIPPAVARTRSREHRYSKAGRTSAQGQRQAPQRPRLRQTQSRHAGRIDQTASLAPGMMSVGAASRIAADQSAGHASGHVAAAPTPAMMSVGAAYRIAADQSAGHASGHV